MRIIITYQYFLPAFKAGGPIQSISNIASFLAASKQFEIFIVCSHNDLDNSVLNVAPDKWVAFAPNINVYYKSGKADKKSILGILKDIQPALIFINGLYSLPFTIYPLQYRGAARKILSVRGMLHPGALSQKTLKKRLFLTAFKALGLHRKCEYHATTEDEVNYIKQEFGQSSRVWMVPNLPNVLEYQQPFKKEVGSVKLVSISLISPMKNILLILHALKYCKSNVVYHIYGPVKDSEYWKDCMAYLPQLPANISVEYKGEVQPVLIKDTLKDYHYFILPSKSENFGHAIYEALSAGKPVITSNNTPWNGLRQANAGYNINPGDAPAFTAMLEEVVAVPGDEYALATRNAKKYISEQYNLDNIKDLYVKMFSLKEN